MCKYCKMHAKGYEKWYLNPDGYNEEFFYKLSKLDRILHRKPKKVRLALQDNESVWYPLGVSKLMDFVNMASNPIIGRLVKMFSNYLALHTSGGQVVPLEDALKIVDLSYGHAMFHCNCKKLFQGQEEYKCLNFGPFVEINRKIPTGWKEKRLSPEEAKEKLEEFSEEGYVHTIFWYGEMPQSICVCNCDAKYCYAARPKTWYDIEKAYRRAEYLAVVNSDECNSCGNCIERCQFGAITLGNEGRAVVDQTICFGCGQCRGVCEQNALKLVDRNTHPIAQKIW